MKLGGSSPLKSASALVLEKSIRLQYSPAATRTISATPAKLFQSGCATKSSPKVTKKTVASVLFQNLIASPRALSSASRSCFQDKLS